jgi:hypothetical protein
VNSVKNDDPSCILPGDDAEVPPAKPARAKKKEASLPLFGDGESTTPTHPAPKRQ